MNINEMDLDTLNKYLENLNKDINLYQLNINEINKIIDLLTKKLENAKNELKIYEENEKNNIYNRITIISVMSYLTLFLIILKLFNSSLPISIPNSLIVTIGCYIKQGINFSKIIDDGAIYFEKYDKEEANKTNSINLYKKELSDNLFMLNGANKEREKVIQKIKVLKKG